VLPYRLAELGSTPAAHLASESKPEKHLKTTSSVICVQRSRAELCGGQKDELPDQRREFMHTKPSQVTAAAAAAAISSHDKYRRIGH